MITKSQKNQASKAAKVRKELAGKEAKVAKAEKAAKLAKLEAVKLQKQIEKMKEAPSDTNASDAKHQVDTPWEVVEDLRKRADITREDAAMATRNVLQSVMDILLTKGRVQLPKFGTFKIITRKEKSYQNPKNRKETVVKPSHKRIKFIPTSTLKVLPIDELI